MKDKIKNLNNLVKLKGIYDYKIIDDKIYYTPIKPIKKIYLNDRILLNDSDENTKTE